MAGFDANAIRKLKDILEATTEAQEMLGHTPKAFAGAAEKDELWLATAASEGTERTDDGATKAESLEGLMQAIEYELTGKRTAADKQLDLILHWIDCFTLLARQIRQLEAMRDAIKQ